MCHLVLPGTHAEFAQYLRSVYGPGGGAGQPAARPVFRPEDLMGIAVEDVGTFVRYGTYWNNPVWGCEEYQWFMQAAIEDGRSWAMTWVDDFQLASDVRNPVDPRSVAETRRALLRLERELSNDT